LSAALLVRRPRVQLLVNPHAGSWSHGRVERLHRAFEKAGATVLLSQCGPDEPPIADDVDHVCAIGGDGTLKHLVRLAGEAPRTRGVSLYPAGTINLLARECRYPRDPDAFARRVLADAPLRQHHVALAGDVPFFVCASVGPDSFAVAGVSLRLKRLIGRTAYGVAFLAVLARWPRPRLRLRDGERDIACEAVYIAKGRFFAGPWSFAPQASVDDPTLHVVALHRATRLHYLRFLALLLLGRSLVGRRGITCLRTRALTIEGADGAPLQADGDIVAHLPVTLGIASKPVPFA